MYFSSPNGLKFVEATKENRWGPSIRKFFSVVLKKQHRLPRLMSIFNPPKALFQ